MSRITKGKYEPVKDGLTVRPIKIDGVKFAQFRQHSRSKYLLALETDAAVNSGWCRWEYETAAWGIEQAKAQGGAR